MSRSTSTAATTTSPTVIADLPADSRVIAEEVFGPVLTVQPFDTEDEAVALANGTPYGLAAGLQTRDVARAHRVAARLDAGIVWVNDWAMLDPAVPFGGVKDSGFGREYGPEALEAYTKVKSVVVSLPQPQQSSQQEQPMTITTQAAVVESGGAPFTLVDVELDEPRADEVLVRMTAAGLCHTDLGVASGGLPFPLPGVLGHEGAGVVERVGSAVTSVAPGDHVLLSFTSCGGCGNCRGGHPAYCATWLPDNLIGGARRDGSRHHHPRRRAARQPLLRPVLVRPAWPSPTSGASSRSTRTRRWRRSPRSAAECRPASARCGTCSSPARAAPSSSPVPARSACPP